VDDLARFLDTLGLAQYRTALADNDVDFPALLLLTEADLKDLGVSLGHRRKLLAAIAGFGGPDAVDAMPVEPIAGTPPADRRQLTVMFCDLVGSTALSGALDPERMEPVLRAYQDVCAGEITRVGGFINQFQGDGVLAYFGYPQASEDAAERAVWAGLGIVDAARRLPSPSGAPLAVRIGIASGLVLTRGKTLRGGVTELPVVGDTVNLAARLQTCADPDSVVVAEATHRLIEGLFECEALGTRELKGVARPVQVWRVASKRAAATRFEATHAAGSMALVGRDQEVALLLDRWESAKAGDGQVVLLSGEAGIGKSRIGQALCEHVETGGQRNHRHRTVRYQCSPFHTNSALQPAMSHLEHACGIGPHDPARTRLDKLERWALENGEHMHASVPLLAAQLAIPTEGRHPQVALSPEQQKERLLSHLAEFLAGSEREPVLFLVEDAHWIDPTTRELLDMCVDRASASSCLTLVTFRPEFQHEWSARAEVTALALNRIGRRQSAELVQSVAGGRLLPAEVLDQIVSKTDGVPLFIEELTRAVLESGLLRAEQDRYDLAGPLPSLAIPATLQDSLLARLDRLGPAKELAQVGAVIGREFSYEAVAALSSLAAAALDPALHQLVAAELVHQRGHVPKATYVFKHALVQDAAYGTILLSRRQQLHARCAEVLQLTSAELADRKPEMLAHHYIEAGLADQAIAFWLKAGQRAAERSANLEAIGHLAKGLDVLAGQPPGEARDRCELLLQSGLGLPLMACRGYASPETGEAFRRAYELAEQLGDAAQRTRAVYGLWAYNCSLGENRAAEGLAERLLELAVEADDYAVALVAHRALGVSRYLLGDQVGGRAEIEAALQSYDVAAHRPLAHRFGQDQRIAGLAALSVIEWIEGYPDKAHQTSRAAIEAALEIEHANSLGYALSYGACPVALLRGDWEHAERMAAMLLNHARDHRLGLWHAHALAYRAEILAEHGEFTPAIADFRAALQGFKGVVSGLRVPAHKGAFAHTLARAGQLHEALVVADDAIEQAEQREERWCLAELLRVKGGILVARGYAERAETAFLESLDASRRQGMPGWELRASVSLGTLWRGLGRSAEAFDLVSAALAPFTEGAATMDVLRARQFLDDLGLGQRAAAARFRLTPVNCPEPASAHSRSGSGTSGA